MKRITLVALASLALASVSAANYELSTPYSAVTGEEVVGVKSTILSRGENQSVVYTAAEKPYDCATLNGLADSTTLAQALQITKNFTTEFAGANTGAKITKFHFYTGGNTKTRVNEILNYTIFLTNDLQKAPFYTQEYTTNTTESMTQCTVVLDEPYTLEAGKEVYIGMKYTTTSKNDYTIVYDGLPDGDYRGSWYAVEKATTVKGDDGKYYTVTNLEWDNLGDDAGALCISATIEGENFPDNRVIVNNISVQPIINKNEPFRFDVAFTNNGATSITSIGYEYTIGNQEAITGTYKLGESLAYSASTGIYVTDNVYTGTPGENIDIKFTITEVNGNTNNSEYGYSVAQTYVLDEGKGYNRNVVIEEFTGTWCGWCPRGIVAMERIREEFPNGELIPIAVHSQDEMYNSTWGRVLAYNKGLPDATINREHFTVNPEYNNIMGYYNDIKNVPALGKVDLEYTFDADTTNIIITATTEFAVDVENAADKYALSFAITEDNVGPYKQTNYYSGMTTDCGGWEKKPQSVMTMYNDVARQLIDFKGSKNSIPESVEAETEYPFELTKRLNSSIKNTKNINVIAYLLDTTTGGIVNACIVKHPEVEDGAGVADVIANGNNAPVEYFNLQGVPVANPETGVYIRRQGTSVSKVYVK